MIMFVAAAIALEQAAEEAKRRKDKEKKEKEAK